MATKNKKSDKNKKQIQRELTVDGIMFFGQLNNGLHIADFQACEKARVEAFGGQCKVQVMRDGNVYITELPKRVRNKVLFREDNMSLSKGRDHKYYVYFSLPEEELGELPRKLVTQAINLADKVRAVMLNQSKNGGEQV